MYDRFNELCKNHMKSMKEVCDDIGIKSSAVSNWKTRGSSPNGDTLLKISKYFGVSMEYLMTGQEPAETVRESPRESGLSDQERELLDMLRELNQEGYKKALEYIKDLHDMGKYQKSITREQTA